MKILMFPNNAPNAPKLLIGRLPIRQYLVWLGPVFLLIQLNRRGNA